MKKKIIARRMAGDRLLEVKLSDATLEDRDTMIEDINSETHEYFIKDVKLRVYTDKKWNDWIRDDGAKISEDSLKTYDF